MFYKQIHRKLWNKKKTVRYKMLSYMHTQLRSLIDVMTLAKDPNLGWLSMDKTTNQ